MPPLSPCSNERAARSTFVCLQPCTRLHTSPTGRTPRAAGAVRNAVIHCRSALPRPALQCFHLFNVALVGGEIVLTVSEDSSHKHTHTHAHARDCNGFALFNVALVGETRSHGVGGFYAQPHRSRDCSCKRNHTHSQDAKTGPCPYIGAVMQDGRPCLASPSRPRAVSRPRQC